MPRKLRFVLTEGFDEKRKEEGFLLKKTEERNYWKRKENFLMKVLK
jgi:hypothetical protein